MSTETTTTRIDAAIGYSIAHTDDEFDAIHRLNYQGFVEEIPQHPPNTGCRLIDRFHMENTYVIAKNATQVVGMVCLRGARPFSLEAKLEHLDQHFPFAAQSPCELRLLYVEPVHRRSSVFYGLAKALFAQAIRARHDLALVSASLREMRLYKHLGFVAFAHEVGSAEARYQPMWLDLARMTQAVPYLVADSDER